MVGAASAASFYVPISKVKRWSWETSWAVAGLFSWILLPISISLMLLGPNFASFYGNLDASVIIKAILFGAMWGVGNVNYGLTMRYLGMSLGIGVAIGVTLVVGTLVPPAMHGQLFALFSTPGGILTLEGVAVALVGVAVVSYAGHLKEQKLGVSAEQFDLKKGLLLALMCGIFSSGFSFAMDAATPARDHALALGVDPLYASLPSYVMIMGGGAFINLAYCFVRLAFKSELSIKRDFSEPAGRIVSNAAMSATGGIMWYLQFFFYAWGAASIPQRLSHVNWMLHMSGYVLCGGLVGLALGEWKKSGAKPVLWLCIGMAVIILAANLVGLGMRS